MPRRSNAFQLPFALLLAVVSVASAAAEPLEFAITFTPDVSAKPFTGRVYVMLSKTNLGDRLTSGPNWFQPEPFFALDVKDWKPGDRLKFGADAIGYPAPLAGLPAGKYYAQAVLDFGRGINFTTTEGNGYSIAKPYNLDPAAGGKFDLTIDHVFHARPFKETDRVKLVDIPSKLLSDFHGRPIRLRAGVALPKSFASAPTQRYPVVYEIPGFGGDHFGAFNTVPRTDVAGVDMLWVTLDPSCPLGHHVFADSANNGPYGKALIEELIPHIEKTFRGWGKPAGRFVTGHSSGGWSSLWLQTTYPEVFGGLWSTSPDPVDFRDFQRIDLTKPGVNMFTDADGAARPLARFGDKPVLFYKAFSDMEVVMGHGGQLGSFEAVFSPRGPDGKPRILWDRKTGAVDPEVAKSWEPYDIRLKLEKNWKDLAPKLAGKMHVYMGSKDTFYLEGATMLLQESQKKLGSDAVIEIFPGRNHGNLLDPKMRERIAREMADQFKAHKE